MNTDLTPEQIKELKDLSILIEKVNELAPYNKIYGMFPDSGPLSRDKYAKHIKAFEATAKFPQVAFCGGNQVGKSEWGAIQCAYHLTGDYPSWWNGRKYNRPVKIALYAVTNSQLRDASGAALLGEADMLGTGSIPKDKIFKSVRKQGTGNFTDYVLIEHKTNGVFDGYSKMHFFTHQQGREAIQGLRNLDIVWFDEEPEESFYSEALVRTAASDGALVLLTFTPLKGLSEVALRFFPDGQLPAVFAGNTYVEQVTWDDVPHISEERKKFLLSEMSPIEIDARVRGIPVAGIGMVFPVPNDVIAYQPFDIPDDWPRVYGFDYSKKRCAVVFVAKDPISQTCYLYDLYVTKTFDYILLSNAIRMRGGDWMYGVAETKNSSYDSNLTYFDIFKKEYGLSLQPANQKAGHKSAAIAKTFNMLATGRFRVAANLTPWFTEKNVFHYEEKGDQDDKPKVHKVHDDIMDATIYVADEGLKWMRVNPSIDLVDEWEQPQPRKRNPITGY